MRSYKCHNNVLTKNYSHLVEIFLIKLALVLGVSLDMLKNNHHLYMGYLKEHFSHLYDTKRMPSSYSSSEISLLVKEDERASQAVPALLTLAKYCQIFKQTRFCNTKSTSNESVSIALDSSIANNAHVGSVSSKDNTVSCMSDMFLDANSLLSSYHNKESNKAPLFFTDPDEVDFKDHAVQTLTQKDEAIFIDKNIVESSIPSTTTSHENKSHDNDSGSGNDYNNDSTDTDRKVTLVVSKSPCCNPKSLANIDSKDDNDTESSLHSVRITIKCKLAENETVVEKIKTLLPNNILAKSYKTKHTSAKARRYSKLIESRRLLCSMVTGKSLFDNSASASVSKTKTDAQDLTGEGSTLSSVVSHSPNKSVKAQELRSTEVAVPNYLAGNKLLVNFCGSYAHKGVNTLNNSVQGSTAVSESRRNTDIETKLQILHVMRNSRTAKTRGSKLTTLKGIVLANTTRDTVLTRRILTKRSQLSLRD